LSGKGEGCKNLSLLLLKQNKYYDMENLKDKYKEKKLETVGKARSNWRVKIYPKPRIWITKETLKNIKK
jgi:hypothetical protein